MSTFAVFEIASVSHVLKSVHVDVGGSDECNADYHHSSINLL